jgi:hypothetical protein
MTKVTCSQKKMDTKSRDQPLHVPGLKYCTKEMFDLFIIVEEAYRAEVLLVFKKKKHFKTIAWYIYYS